MKGSPNPKPQIFDLSRDDEMIRRVAEVLIDGFTTSGVDPWPTIDEAIEEVESSLESGKISRVAIDESGEILGWIGGYHLYAFVWELHPLVVRADAQGRGIGAMLVNDLEAKVSALGGLTIFLGADDENYRTSIGRIDLYPNVIDKLSRIKNIANHPFEFYEKLGYEVTGTIPDANGFGKPDILMCKRVGLPPETEIDKES